MERNRERTRLHSADGYLLVEAIVGVVLLGVGALGVAAALGQAEQLASLAVQRDREAGIRADLAATLMFGLVSPGAWLPVADLGTGESTPCWHRMTAMAEGFLWVEARCGVGADDLPADAREPGLLVRR